MISISEITANVNAILTNCQTLTELAKVITQKRPDGAMWSPTEYKDGYRNSSNALRSPSLFVVDIDDGLPLLAATARLDSLGLSYIIAPSRSHQILKNDVVCDRYRIVLELESPIESPEDHAATWLKVQADLFPEMDPSCKDFGRGYYYSTSVFKVREGGIKVSTVLGQKLLLTRQVSNTPVAGQKGHLSAKTMRTLHERVAKGGRDNAAYAAACNLHKANYTEDEATSKLNSAPFDWDSKFTPKRIEEIVRSVYRKGEANYYPAFFDPNMELREFAEVSKLILDVDDEHANVLLNDETKERQTIDLGRLRMLLGRQYDMYMQQQCVIAKYAYDPTSKAVLYKSPTTGITMYNQYSPPFWLADFFYQGKPLPTAPSAPPGILQEFLMHLVDSDAASYEYVLDWIATTVNSRNVTVLTAIGEQGVGKGTLAEIITCLVGNSNASKVRADIFKGRFNSQMENKKFVHVDEVALKNQEEYNRFKDIVNPVIEIEGKGKDAKSVENFASYYLAANDSNAINPGSDDRRFSIIELTKIKIKDSKFRDQITHLKSNEVISEFAAYLLQHKVKNDMLTPFKAKRKSAEIAQAALKDWEVYILEDFLEEYVGKSMSYQDANQILLKSGTMGYGAKGPGRRKWENFCKQFPQYIKYVAKELVIIDFPKGGNV